MFWEQRGIKEDVTVTRNPEMTKKAFRIHMNDIIQTYGPVQIINLTRDRDKREMRLTREYIRQVYESDLKDQINFLNFDFHHYCGGDKYQALKVMVQKIDQELIKHGYFVENINGRKVEAVQQGVIRSNCLDSLDRTNVAQSKIGIVMLQLQLRRLGFDLQSLFGPEVMKQGLAFMYEPESDNIIQRFRAMWVEQADYLSRQYAGTDSTISRVTRDGKEGFIGKIDHKTKVIQRFLINTFTENPM